MVKEVKKDKQQSKRSSESKSLNLRKRRLSKRFSKMKVDSKSKEKGIIYVGHLPKGFNEKELKSFFQQFGTITKLRVSRSVKTARSRGFAFIEYEDKQVAHIAAQTMNKYIIFSLLKQFLSLFIYI